MNTIVNTTESAVEYLDLQVESDLTRQYSVNDTFLIRFSNELADNIIHDATTIPVTPLEHSQILELWQGMNASNAANVGDWQYYCNNQYLMAAVPAVPAGQLHDMPIDGATEAAYELIFSQITRWGYPCLLRTWNYFPEITAGHSSINNYQLFCSGRSRAYEIAALKPSTYPAATVIGTSQPGLHIYFIAARNHGTAIENSQQVSAYHYPPTYSQDPPLFSRALLHRNRQQQVLFVSGTASITGHSTQFADDINRQLEVCIDNIDNLLATAATEHGFARITLRECRYLKVYLRKPDHLDTVRTHLQLHLGPSVDVYFIQGEMCRPDLLVEIEALALCAID